MTDSVPVLGGSMVLGRYRVVRELARGGMGMVYLGRIEGAAGFAKPVVIKRVLSHMSDSDGSRAQFIREARLLSELQHPNIVGVIDFGEENGSYLMVLEYVHGFHVGHWLKYATTNRNALEWEFAVYVVGRVLSALHYAHTRLGPDGKVRPIIHRDVSPGNVLIDLEGSVRLLDFGIARASGDMEQKTQEGIVKGKLPFIAPEMYQSKDASVASDVYAAGVMLYQLLAGKNPFSGKDMGTIVTRVLTHRPAPISTHRSDVPKELDRVLQKSLSKNPAARYHSAQAFAQALSELFTRSEAEIAEQMRLTITADFTGDIADQLKVASLAELDSAWRASARDPSSEQPLQRSSTLPPEGEPATMVISNPQLEALTNSTRDEFSVHDQATTQMDIRTATQLRDSSSTIQRVTGTKSGPTDNAPAEASGPHPAANASSNTRTIILSTLGAGLLAGGIAAAVLFWGQSEPKPQQQRFLLVERPDQQGPSPAPAPAPQPTPAPDASGTPTDSGDKPAPDAPPKSAAPQVARPAPKVHTPSQSQALTAAFARRQGAVQGCFSKSSDQLEGSPQVSIRFEIGGQGQVLSAAIRPGSLGGTSLGQCLLSVARGTQFPQMGETIAFSIPITAQVVKR